MASVSGQPARELSSWKEIAAFLGVNVRTAQRWETERGLPVTRLPGGKGRVVANTADLLRWKETTPRQAPWWGGVRFLRWYAVLATVVIVGAAAVLVAKRVARTQQGPPAQLRFEYRTLVALNQRGEEVWRRMFPEPIATAVYNSPAAGRNTWFGDIDGDSAVETLFVFQPATLRTSGSVVYCFSQDGREKWRFVPGKVVTDQGATYGPLFTIPDFAVSRGRVMVVANNVPHYPSQFAVLDGRGALRAEYWHSGHLDSFDVGDLDGDGADEIALVGINNGYRAATLVVLDSRKVGGASTQEPGSPYQLKGFSTGAEKAVALFPRTCINEALEWYNIGKSVRISNGVLAITVQERLDEPSHDYSVLYRLDGQLRVLSAEYTDRLKALHRQMTAAGQLDHALSDAEIARLAQARILKAWVR